MLGGAFGRADMLELPDHFQLFELPPRFALDAAALDHAYRRVQSQVHPDRFAAGSAAENRVAMQWATQANEAYRTLKSPLKRAAYLCERAGVSVDAESNTSMPHEFLMQQLEWREALDEARVQGNSAALSSLGNAMALEQERLLAAIGRALDVDSDPAHAASLVRQLMFVEKFGTEASAAVNAYDNDRASA